MRPCNRTCSDADSRAKRQSSSARDIDVVELDRVEWAAILPAIALKIGSGVGLSPLQDRAENVGTCLRPAPERSCPRVARLHRATKSHASLPARRTLRARDNDQRWRRR